MSSDVSTTPTGGTAADPDSRLKAALHRVFDSQIPNYGDYNLVCSTECGGTVAGPVPGPPPALGFVIGYRRRPVELVIAPFERATLAPAGQPTTVDLTNLAYAAEPLEGSFDVATSTGRVLTFTVHGECMLPLEGEDQHLAQEDDAADLRAFLDELGALGSSV
ncbi:hypothetical protein [Sinomonas halotolerans]|uniref:YbjN domain-containing protein n=1 Tax=Sinomonas halotolerans TaxID=1644133 RepID=A0ABU9WWX9_9MICC